MTRGTLWVCLVASLLACDTTVQTAGCGPDSCAGCCTSTGACVSGVDLSTCGSAGTACVNCASSGQTCWLGRCAVTSFGVGGGAAPAGGGAAGGLTSNGGGMGGGTAGGLTSSGGGMGGGAAGGLTSSGGGRGGGSAGGAGGGSARCDATNCLGCCSGNVCQAVTGALCGINGGRCQVCSGTCELRPDDAGVVSALCRGAVDGGTGRTDGGADSSGPTLVAFTVTPSSFDTSDAGQRVRLHVEVVDDLSGPASSIHYTLEAPNRSGLSTSMRATTVSGLTAVYDDDVELPRHWQRGKTTVSLSLRDNAENTTRWSASQLAAAGFADGFTQTGAGDSTSPVITSFTVTPNVVDTSMMARSVTLTATVTDDLAGLGDSFFFTVTAPGSNGFSTSIRRTGGSGLSATYSGTHELDRYSPAGTYTLDVSVNDLAWNSARLSSAQLAAAGFSSSFSQVGAGDAQGPRLVSFTVSPRVISTANADATVTLTLVVSDDVSGPETYQHYTLERPTGGLSTSMRETSRTGLTATFQDTVTVPRFSPLGTTRLSLSLRDRAGNSTRLSTGQLSDAGFAADFTNQ